MATASVIMVAAPRPEAVLPPRSLVAEMTGGGQRGADGGGQPVQARDQQALALDLGESERHALLGVPTDPLLLGVDIDEGERIRAGQQRRGWPAQPGTPGAPSAAAARCPK